MTVQEIATQLYEYCKEGNFSQAEDDLYADDVTSTETNQKWERETLYGKMAKKNKSNGFRSLIEQVYSSYINQPKLFWNYFFIETGMDVSLKGIWRVNMIQMCRYEVKNGKIINEEFYY